MEISKVIVIVINELLPISDLNLNLNLTIFHVINHLGVQGTRQYVENVLAENCEETATTMEACEIDLDNTGVTVESEEVFGVVRKPSVDALDSEDSVDSEHSVASSNVYANVVGVGDGGHQRLQEGKKCSSLSMRGEWGRV